MRKFRIEIITPALIIAHGRIDTETAPELEKALLSCYKDKEVCIDLTDVYYISSAGLRVLLKAVKENRNTYLGNPSEVVMEILDITGFTDIFKIRTNKTLAFYA